MSDRGEGLNMAFARHLLEDGKILKTVESYTVDVLGFLRHLCPVGDPFYSELQPEVLLLAGPVRTARR